ncbi:protoporphyrinogen oxidase isoform X2 [Gambusia affinis]|uniref:protoporphyrinogen oxidase isoform X2 n=1 Tax=Gambusia affinis TaxID=33528 RepID=UPI001CDB4BFB|nr:protoporphyrinogen oxidase isoform X2 [Gambusia affinis]
MKTVAVLGGGIGGLAASFYLCKNPQVAKVIVLESSSRFGGWLWSLRRSDGAVFELGPRGIRPAGAVGTNTLNMVEDLGLEEAILPVSYNHVASKNRYLYVNGQLHKLPSGISGILKTVAPFSRPLLFSLLTEIFVKKGREEDESIHSFVSRRLGKELADLAVDSVCRGVFAGDCKKLSVRSCFPWLYMAEQQRGSLTLGFLLGSGSAPEIVPGPLAQRAKREAWAQWSLKRGVETLPESITEFLQQSGKVELHRDAAVGQIIPTTSGWKVHLEDGVISADHLMAALPAKALSCILPPSCQGLVQQLQDISTVTVAVASLEYEGSILPVTVMMGGAWFQNVFGAPQAVSADSLLARATEAVRCHLGHCVAPSWSHVALHRDCIPQYHLGHFQRVDTMRAFIKNNNLLLSLIGSAYDGVSVNDVIFSGRRAVAELLGGGV